MLAHKDKIIIVSGIDHEHDDEFNIRMIPLEDLSIKIDMGYEKILVASQIDFSNENKKNIVTFKLPREKFNESVDEILSEITNKLIEFTKSKELVFDLTPHVTLLIKELPT
jgi:hypothetical protein